MNKAQFIDKISKKTDFTKADVECLLDATFSLIEKSVSKGEEIKIVGFGAFDRLTRKSRTGRNPQTGKTLTIPQTKVPRFRPGKDFKELVNNNGKKKQPQSSH